MRVQSATTRTQEVGAITLVGGSVGVVAGGGEAQVTFGQASSGDSAETFPRSMVQGASAYTAGAIFATRITLPQAAYTTLTVGISVQGVTLTNTFFGVYDINGNRLAVSADLSTPLAAVAAGGIYQPTLNCTISTAGDYLIAFLNGTASTPPQFWRGQAQILGSTGSLSPRMSGRSSATGLTALPDPIGAYNDTVAAPSMWIRYA